MLAQDINVNILFRKIFNHFKKPIKGKKSQFIGVMVLQGDEKTISVAIKISHQAKMIKIKITLKHEVELIIPDVASLAVAKLFLFNKKQWIFNKLKQRNPKKIRLVADVMISVFGQKYKIIYGGDARGNTRIENNQIIVFGREENISNRVKRFLNAELSNEIASYAKKIGNILKVKAKKISIRDNSSNWGSCSISGNISFSWRLIFAPLPILHYVIIHELCHMIEHNHSKKYWDLVVSLCPDYKAQKQWLKINGNSLLDIS